MLVKHHIFRRVVGKNDNRLLANSILKQVIVYHRSNLEISKTAARVKRGRQDVHRTFGRPRCADPPFLGCARHVLDFCRAISSALSYIHNEPVPLRIVGRSCNMQTANLTHIS